MQIYKAHTIIYKTSLSVAICAASERIYAPLGILSVTGIFQFFWWMCFLVFGDKFFDPTVGKKLCQYRWYKF